MEFLYFFWKSAKCRLFCSGLSVWKLRHFWTYGIGIRLSDAIWYHEHKCLIVYIFIYTHMIWIKKIYIVIDRVLSYNWNNGSVNNTSNSGDRKCKHIFDDQGCVQKLSRTKRIHREITISRMVDHLETIQKTQSASECGILFNFLIVKMNIPVTFL